jgi:hypothetical protein
MVRSFDDVNLDAIPETTDVRMSRNRQMFSPLQVAELAAAGRLAIINSGKHITLATDPSLR